MPLVRDLSGNGYFGLDAHIAEPGGSGGGSGDASAANQVLANTKLDTLHTDLQSLINGTSTINVAEDISVVYIGSTSYAVVRAPINLAASGDLLAAQGAGKKIYILSYSLVSAGAGTIKFQSNAATDLTGAMDIAANGGLVDTESRGVLVSGTNEKINIVLTGAATAKGRYAYIVV